MPVSSTPTRVRRACETRRKLVGLALFVASLFGTPVRSVGQPQVDPRAAGRTEARIAQPPPAGAERGERQRPAPGEHSQGAASRGGAPRAVNEAAPAEPDRGAGAPGVNAERGGGGPAQPDRGAGAPGVNAERGGGGPAQPDRGAGAPGVNEDEHASRGIVDALARLVNFAILAGTLVYFLRSPIRKYLVDRSAQIRSDLVNAAEMKQTAAAQIDEINRKMKALPAELDALRAQGAEEIAAEEARIRAAAATERERLLEQARREIDLQVKVAERDLVSHAADLAVGVAAERIKKTITDDDQKRLVDRYVQQLKG